MDFRPFQGAKRPFFKGRIKPLASRVHVSAQEQLEQGSSQARGSEPVKIGGWKTSLSFWESLFSGASC